MPSTWASVHEAGGATFEVGRVVVTREIAASAVSAGMLSANFRVFRFCMVLKSLQILSNIYRLLLVASARPQET